MAGFDPDAYLAQQPKFDPDAYLAATPANEGMPAPRGGFKARVAGLADTALNIIPQALAETGYAGVRALEGVGLAKPGQAAQGRQAVLDQFSSPVGKTLGVTNTPEYQNEASQRIGAYIGEHIGKGAKWIAQQTGLPETDVENMAFSLGFAVPGAAKGALKVAAPVAKKVVAPAVEAIAKPFEERAARTREANVARSYENAAQIDAANLAVKHGIAINPAESNPTKVNRIKSTITGATNLNENLSKINDVKFTNLAKEDMGLPTNTPLNAKAFETALSKHSGAYDAVRGISQLAPDEGALGQIASLRIERPVIGGEASAAAVNTLVDEALNKVREGRSGAEIITDIRKLRKDANNVYSAQQKSGVPDPTLVAKADASIGVANALESLIEANVTDPKLLAELRKSRAEMAKIYDYERATNFATGRIDPQVLAKMAEEGKPLSGTAADIGKIAAVFPDIAQSGKSGMPMWAPERLTRSGAAGTVGFALGSTVGAPLAGAVGGAAVGNILSGLAGRRISTPAYQAANALPQDFRAPVNNLRPAPPSTTSNLPVVYDYRNSLLTPNEIPNWVYGRTPPEGNVQVGTPPGPMLEAPSAESTMRGVNQRRAFDYQSEKAAADAAAAQQAAQEAASRTNTGAGTVFELDPITGKLRNVSQGLKGATPATLESTGHNLAAAANKVASGKLFDMTAAEKVAWNKTKVDFASIDASFAKLSDKALAEKAMDRAWVADAITKAKQKAAAFDEIAKRSQDAQQVQRAIAERERLMDALEGLEDMRSRPRAASSTTQGPKTRQAIINNMIENRSIKNKLRND